MVLLDRLVDELAAPPLTTAKPLLLITLMPWGDLEEPIAGGRTRPGYGFKREWLDPVLRDREADVLEMATSSWWRLAPDRVRRRGIDYAVPVFRGVTRGLLKIDSDKWEQVLSERWRGSRHGFVAAPVLSGPLFDEVVGPHGHRVTGKARGSQNPVSYWPPLATVAGRRRETRTASHRSRQRGPTTGSTPSGRGSGPLVHAPAKCPSHCCGAGHPHSA
jgi:uncharacterized protein